MSNRKQGERSSGNKRGGARGNSGKKQGTANKRGKGRGRARRSKKVDLDKYWGVREVLPDLDEHTTSTPGSSTVVDSLGRPPIPGHENASRHYFGLVYERASNLAVALAAAGGLNDFANGGEPADESDEPV